MTNMSSTLDGVKLITDETQYVVGEVKGFVGGIKTKCEDLEKVVVEDVKGVIDEIRKILDQVPKMPEVPADYDAAGMFGGVGVNLADYIPGMSSPKVTDAPPTAPAPELTPVATQVPGTSTAKTPLQQSIANNATAQY